MSTRSVGMGGSMFGFFAHTFAFGVLTLLTQVGGIAYALTVLASKRASPRRVRGCVLMVLIFVGLYAAVSALASVAASLTGRVPLPCFVTADSTRAVQSPIYCVLNRHYVSRKLDTVFERLASHMDRRYPGTVTLALDANFPLIDGFPLLPHLSHDDSRKLDLALFYRQPGGPYMRGKTKSRFGYWAFEQPVTGETSQCADGMGGPTLRWDLAWLQRFHGPGELDETRTREMLRWLAQDGRATGIEKVFVEPHLQRRLGVQGPTLRFQGCRAARHDDHVHVQVSR